MPYRGIRVILVMSILACLAIPASAQDELKLPRISPGASVSQTVGLTDMTVTYSRPGVKGRVIWGELVPYGETWRTGANEATLFETSDDVMIEGKTLPAGKYALFTVPNEKMWTVVFNSQADQWGAFSHDETKDVLKLEITPRAAADHREWMMFQFVNLTPTTAELQLQWERLMLPLKIEVSLEKAKENVLAAMANYDGEKWQTPYRCASFYHLQGWDLDQAVTWNTKSLEVEETYFNTRLMAELMSKKGDRKMAIDWGEKAIKLGKERKDPIDTRPVERWVAEWRGND